MKATRWTMKRLACLCTVFVFLAPTLLFAQQYPTKPVTVTIGYAPGGAMDLCVRALASASEKYLGQSFIIVNTAGGGGSVAYSVVAKQKPDGYHIMGNSTSGFLYTPHLRNVPYTLQDFVPIVIFAKTPHKAIAVRPDSPWKTLKELVAYARSNPGKLTYSHVGMGSVQNIGAETIAMKEGVQWTGIPHKSAVEAMMALLGGHVDFTSTGLHENWDHVKAGKARVLATLDDGRCTELAPNAPTLQELGYGFNAELNVIMVAPKGTPPPIVKKLEEVFAKGTKDPQFIQAMDNLKNEIYYLNSQDTKKYLDEAYVRLGRLIKDLRIPTEKDK
jgi:tripartite-type tricarboxylate transporter receptor subunit TctC